MARRKDPAATRTPRRKMEAAGHHLPAFTPVPTKPRHDGWTPDRQRAFIAALADTGSVTHACRHVWMTTEGVYHLRRQPGAESFAAAWRAALASTGAPAPPDPLPLTPARPRPALPSPQLSVTPSQGPPENDLKATRSLPAKTASGASASQEVDVTPPPS